MLNRFTIKQRLYLIIITILAFFLVMTYFAVQNSYKARDMGIVKTGEVMLDIKKQIDEVQSTTTTTVGEILEVSNIINSVFWVF